MTKTSLIPASLLYEEGSSHIGYLADSSPICTTQPFLKWAGGKRWLVAEHSALLPTEFNTYYEPFLGSGAVFFKLAPNKAVLSDINSDLIDTYKSIRDEWQSIVPILNQHQRFHSKNYYYLVRSQNPRSKHIQAARFLYLNRTCWNGLYRVNLKGVFNVPIGTKKKVIMDSDNFENIAKLLRVARLEVRDFETCINEAMAGDFIFVDPPYTVKHDNNGFIKYNDNIFKWADQERLRDALVRADTRGAMFMVTNANHFCVRELYGNYYKRSVERFSVISGSKLGRSPVKELIITNYKAL